MYKNNWLKAWLCVPYFWTVIQKFGTPCHPPPLSDPLHPLYTWVRTRMKRRSSSVGFQWYTAFSTTLLVYSTWVVQCCVSKQLGSVRQKRRIDTTLQYIHSTFADYLYFSGKIKWEGKTQENIMWKNYTRPIAVAAQFKSASELGVWFVFPPVWKWWKCTEVF